MAEVTTIFDCFFIIENNDGEIKNKFMFPQNYEDPSLKQLYMFCFPFDSTTSLSSSIVQRNQHFTFMLTDLEKRHRYGFCKLTNGSKSCFCFISNMPWFEVFYKLLNGMYELHSKSDIAVITTLLNKFYETPVPAPNEVVTLSTSLTFTTPVESKRPSIPESRNLMEYFSSCTPKMMIEIFAALMYERRVIITSSSLSILAGCVFSAENLLYPLNWQHIYIPILPPHVLDYCTAPIPYLIGIHSSLLSSVKRKIHGDEHGIVVVNVDDKTIETPFNDVETIPSDVIAFLRSQLSKSNVTVGTHLSMSFVKAQARLIGSYRNALTIKDGNTVVFDEESYINFHVIKSKRAFAEEVIQLQTFKEFLDKRLELLNGGIGFRDVFEIELNRLQEYEGTTQAAMYKDLIIMKQKGGDLITSMRKRAKENYKVAKQSMIEATKANENPTRPTLTKRQSLKENLKSIRPPRPSPPKPRRKAPPRPPPPKSSSVRKYKVIEFDDEISEQNNNDECKEDSISNNSENIEDNTEQPNLLIDFSDLNSASNNTCDDDVIEPTVESSIDLLSLMDSDLPDDLLEPTLLQPSQTTIRAAYQISKDRILSPNGEIDPMDLFGFSWQDDELMPKRKTVRNTEKTSAGSDWLGTSTTESFWNEKPIIENQTNNMTTERQDSLLSLDSDSTSGNLPPPLLPGLS